MKITSTICATLLGAAVFTGGAALADERCRPADVAAGLCAPLHLIDDDDYSRSDFRRDAYRQGYIDGLHGYDPDDFVPRPPDVALDNKEGYSLGYKERRRYVERDRYNRHYRDRDDHDRYERRYRDRADYDEWRLRRDGHDRRSSRDDRDEAIDFATDILRRALSN